MPLTAGVGRHGEFCAGFGRRGRPSRNPLITCGTALSHFPTYTIPTLLPFLQVGCDRCQVMTRQCGSWSWRRVGARSAAGSSPTSSAGAVRRHLSMEVRRCDSNSSQMASLTALDPSLVRRRWLILSSLAVQLTLTRLPPRSAPPPPIPRALCAARPARSALPQSNLAPGAPAQRRILT